MNDIQKLIDFLHESPTSYHAAAALAKRLEAAGFQAYQPGRHLPAGARRYQVLNGSSLIAFTVGKNPLDAGFRLVGSHLDSPALKVKPGNILRAEGCLKLNVEVYGGPLLQTWFDRPLSLAGQVALLQDDPLRPELRLVDFGRALAIIPNLAIHMNRSANDGFKVEVQKMLLPVLGLDTPGKPAADQLIPELLAAELDVKPDRIAGYELYLYDPQPGSVIGLNQEFIQAPHLDNKAMAHAACAALIDAKPRQGIAVAACFDHEEVGSHSPQGAASMALRDLLERIALDCGGDRIAFLDAFSRSFMISADQAHAAHPNYPEAADPNHRPRINGGPVIKTSAGRSYMSDAETTAVFVSFCRQAGVPYQLFSNHSDSRGGSTIGPMSAQFLPVATVDVGNPIWAMHAIRETGGVADQAAMTAVMRAFFTG